MENLNGGIMTKKIAPNLKMNGEQNEKTTEQGKKGGRKPRDHTAGG